MCSKLFTPARICDISKPVDVREYSGPRGGTEQLHHKQSLIISDGAEIGSTGI